MSVKKRLDLLDESGKNLLAAIENKSWDQALDYSKQWSACIENLFGCLSSDQLVLYKDELLNIESQHQFIKNRLVHFRAKTLTQLQDISKYHAFNKHYNDMG